ncbi:ORC ubiquitin ligase 1 [Homo sapiens]|uniref:ORC ubiquitin ligase 1 n=2 Tax=Homo sapiens TaxID=9606 RepID=OBI1_HUMAN|nr:ORC ubiquitin ligase 1 [Homo sapiens]Q5W0B1.1 RecName: Full=ORC ubiquitin ligase 1; Short=OBI1; AltName: Full=RING finger protein 219 [Homo sapiens]AAI36765.1 Ring finger protein 219 [Homo sapiens]AAI36766.1 Ring finger protein 219 [Homo sapiens]EAW80586.1 chromosome 13 open reading frame 7, isoform CRA_a [Homo sapiens]KAI2569663.1 ORC ubiquitin ligase 1 [Homo sapiens]KAI4063575.1 ORC ubiquitin ligase 1 [Homo sapiens]|eukprot:NP_078822.3 RING finger protein 219 [Homo sapiens]
MAQTVQNVTLSLTLPITCHICLGKVRQPVICINNHVFCSICIDLWLKNNSQCPACRVPITPENPCKEIIGGTSESEPMLSHTVRKHLRKTRLELLHKEYEDEIDCLQKEVEELKSKNLSLESQIKTILDPLTLVQGNQNEDKHLVTDNPSKINPETVAEWKKKLRTANEIYEKVKDDVDKLKEANKKLKLENGGLVRENLRLKAEVDNRSPQKFGRFAVAALQSKVEQYERETNRLKKALERSDKYIEELESQVAQLKNSSEEKEAMNSICQTALSADGKGSKGSEEDVVSKNQGDSARKQPGSSTSSSSHLAKPSSSRLCDTSSARQESTSKADLNCSKNKDLYQEQVEVMLDVTDTSMDTYLEREWGNKPSDCVPYKDEELYDLPAPCTPLSLSCLQLSTPENRESSVVQAGGSKKHSNHLRKLVFDDFCDSSNVSNKDSSEDDISRSENEKKSECFSSPKTGFWDCCSTSYAQNLDFESSEGNTIANSVGEISSKLSEKSGLCLSKRLNSIRSFEMNRTRTSSEASMDAAYLDKISELDSMMSESDNSKSPCNNGFKSLDLDGLSKSSQGSEFLEEPDKLEEKTELNLSKGSLTNDQLENGSEWKPTSFFLLSPSDQEMNEDFSLHSSSCPVTNEIKPPSCLFQTEFSQGILLSSSHRLFEDQRFGSSLFKMSSEMHSLHNHLQSPWSTSFVPEKRNKNVNQSTKRKIQSSLSSASPSKATKS